MFRKRVLSSLALSLLSLQACAPTTILRASDGAAPISPSANVAAGSLHNDFGDSRRSRTPATRPSAAGLTDGAGHAPDTSDPGPAPAMTPEQAARVAAGGFRYTDAENRDLAGPIKLPWRIFYKQPSSGPDAAWFDAVKHGDLATVQKMVAQGQNIEAKDNDALGQTALGWAAFIGYEDMVDYLIAQGASLQATDRSDVYNVLKSAVLGKNTRIVRKIHALLPDTDLNDQTLDSDGETLLMIAASNDRLETAEYLLSQGADPNLVTTIRSTGAAAYDQSALSYACTRGYGDMQKLLIAHGVINHRTGRSSCE